MTAQNPSSPSSATPSSVEAGNPASTARRGLLIGGGAAAVAVAAGGWTLLGAGRTQVPDVALRTLAGESLKLSDLRGKVVLVNFWATSCTTCVHEMPALAEAHKRLAGQGYETVAVAMSYDRPDYVANFAQERALPFKVAIDLDGAIAKAFDGIRATPTSFLLDKRGAIVQRYVGEPDWAQFEKTVAAELAAA